jgi:ATP-dependent Clp protease protease subunit
MKMVRDLQASLKSCKADFSLQKSCPRLSGTARAHINYTAGVTDKSVQQLLVAVQENLRRNVSSFTILISSPGGLVRAGIAAYNYLKGIPAEVITHNYGQADSIAILLFCAGSKRYSSPNARFLIHGIGFDAQPGQRFDERLLKERLEALKNERETISKIISENSKRSLQQVQEDMFQGVVWTPEQAKDYGLVHEIREPLFERGTTVTSILD